MNELTKEELEQIRIIRSRYPGSIVTAVYDTPRNENKANIARREHILNDIAQRRT